MAEVQTSTPILVADGAGQGWDTDDAPAGVWTAATSVGDPIQATGSVGAASLTYDFQVQLDPERSLALEPPIPFTNAPEGDFFTLQLEMAGGQTPATAGTIIVRVRQTPDAEAWDGTNRPTSPADADFLSITVLSSSDFWVLDGGVWFLQLPIDFNLEIEVHENIAQIVGAARWNGLLNFSITSANTWTIASHSLVGQEIPFNTGWDRNPPSRGRPVLDMKMGGPAFAEDLQEDGFLAGIWTSPSAWDPDDPRRIRPIQFPAEEGVKKDDVPI